MRKGLDKREVGNVMLIDRATDLTARESQELQALRQISDLEPVHTELIQLISKQLKIQDTIFIHSHSYLMSIALAANVSHVVRFPSVYCLIVFLNVHGIRSLMVASRGFGCLGRFLGF